ncbi:hypothetical protein V4F39_20700 [Aquincola sp. MAHUQ-54]|uniref:Carboxypeptidase regulatory-like domain-containing protein n=1 Tax=Aquincola agrisoli TaxID=3119538 RepID=A0AAW9QLA0_9BURK
MAGRLVSADGRGWHFSPDRSGLPGERTRALLRARLVDDIDGQPVAVPLSLRTPRADIAVRAAADGLVGLVAQPARVLPGLAATAAELTLEVRGAGYLPRTLRVMLGPVAGFPADFAPVDLGDVALHRPAVAITGRVMHNTAPQPLPLAGATVEVDAIWPHPPPPFWIAPALAEPPNLFAVAPPLAAPRAAGTALRERTVVLQPAAKALLAPLVPGAVRLRLADADGLAAGGLLAIDIDAAAATELITIAAVEPVSAPDLPAWVTLAHPAARLHRDGVRCAAAVPQPPASTAVLARDAQPHDDTLFTAAAPPMADGAWIEIDDGAAVPEYGRAALPQATTDADGYFALPPLGRIALVRLLVRHAAVADARPLFAVDRAAPALALALD